MKYKGPRVQSQEAGRVTGVLQAWDTFKDEHSLCRAHGNITETEMAYIMSSASVVNVSSKLGFFSFFCGYV